MHFRRKTRKITQKFSENISQNISQNYFRKFCGFNFYLYICNIEK